MKEQASACHNQQLEASTNDFNLAFIFQLYVVYCLPTAYSYIQLRSA
jgi:hypothetical protein